jgi:cysteine desulfurase/selenocysteine lyase
MTVVHELPGLLPGLDLIRADFPILERVLDGANGTQWPLVYLDSANTSQKPQVVIDAMVDHLEHHNANISRAMHQLGAESTEAFEGRSVPERSVSRRGDLHKERL